MADPILCENGAHGTSHPIAIARLHWPEGRYRDATACTGCRDWSVGEAARDLHAITITPIPEAYGLCRVCDRHVVLRMDGAVRAHSTRYGQLCQGSRKQPFVRAAAQEGGTRG